MTSEAKRIILFDAVGTLIYPQPDVIATYHTVGDRYGSRRTPEQVKLRFFHGRKEYFDKAVEVGHDHAKAAAWPSSDQIEYDLWCRLVRFVFDDLDDTDAIMDDLWDHFAQPDHWRVHDDVHNCMSTLRRRRMEVGIASNFDSRLLKICQLLLPQIESRFIFWSSAMGFRKPDRRFYETVASHLKGWGRLTMVGDDRLNDWIAPAKCGWQTYLLDRRKAAEESPAVIHSLLALPARIG